MPDQKPTCPFSTHIYHCDDPRYDGMCVNGELLEEEFPGQGVYVWYNENGDALGRARIDGAKAFKGQYVTPIVRD
jgi:hypothetical protein